MILFFLRMPRYRKKRFVRRTKKRYTKRRYARRTKTRAYSKYSRMQRGMFRGGKELKNVDVEIDDANKWIMDSSQVYTAPKYLLLNGTNQGTAAYHRDGRMIKMLTLSLKGECYIDPTATAGHAANIRVMVVLDRQHNSTAWASSDLTLILGGLNGKGDSLNPSVYAKPRPEYMQRFAILADFVIHRDAWQSGEGPYKKQGSFKIFKRLGIPVTYSATQASNNLPINADIATNALAIIAFTDCAGVDNTPANTRAPSLKFMSRLTFSD